MIVAQFCLHKVMRRKAVNQVFHWHVVVGGRQKSERLVQTFWGCEKTFRN